MPPAHRTGRARAGFRPGFVRSVHFALGLAAAVAVAACANQGNGTQASSGPQIFTDAGCAGCHTLAAARSTGQVGPNLDQVKPNMATVERKVREGGGAMPSFSGQLTPAQIQAVAAYVEQATHPQGPAR